METNESEVKETPAQPGTEDGTNAETSTAAEETTAGEVKEGEEAAEQETASKPVPKYTDADMAEARRKYQGETRKERDARIAAETEARLLREMHGGKTEHKDTARAPEQLVRPKRDDFDIGSDGDAAYEAAKEEYIVKKARAEFKAEDARETQEKTAKEQREVHQKRVNEMIDRGRQEFEDFDDVTDARNLKLTTAMIGAMLDAVDDPSMTPRIEYHLGKNPELAAKIAAMPPARQVKEIVALESTLKSAMKPQTTKAPGPITDVKGGGTAAKNLAEIDDMEEYAARRNQKGK